MMSQAQADITQFQILLEQHFESISQGNGEQALKTIRTKAWDHFLELGLPTRDVEAFRYLKLNAFFSKIFTSPVVTDPSWETISPYVYPESSQSVLVCINGCYSPKHSRIQGLPEKISITTLGQATLTFGAFLNNQWAKSMKEETDAFAAANAALHREGLFIYLPPKTKLAVPIQILNIVDTQTESMLITPRMHFFAGAHSEVEVISSTALISGNSYCINQVNHFSVEEAAHVKYTQINYDEAMEAWHFDAVRANLKKNSTFQSTSITNGSSTVRNDYRVALLGENSEAKLNGIWMLGDRREAHTHVLMDHQAPHTRSMQQFKGVLTDSSHSSFEGKILVRQAAQKTEAYQLNHNLLLSDAARAESKPNLEIFADDVKASHGATIGQLDQEQLFYLRARGCQTPENLLIYGFCKEILDMIPLASIRAQLIQKSLLCKMTVL